jgi:hypothetical protein
MFQRGGPSGNHRNFRVPVAFEAELEKLAADCAGGAKYQGLSLHFPNIPTVDWMISAWSS